MAVVGLSSRPPAEAVAFLRDKAVGQRFSFDWRDTWQQEHVTSFVVAKAMSADLLTDIHDALVKAISEGQTREAFIAALRPTLEAKGWWGDQTRTDPVTGRERTVRLGTPRRLRTIFDTNMRMAHAAGRWQGFERTRKTAPYLIYGAVLDEVTREQHAKWGGRGAPRIVLPIDHPFWRTHYPPNGWRCRCIVSAAGLTMLKALGLTVTTDAELEASGWRKTVPYLNRRTGETLTVPKGIDPGFAYNVGLARRAALVPPPAPEPQRDQVVGDRYPKALPPALKPRPYPRGVSKRPGLEGDAVFDAFAKTLGVPEDGVFFDKAQVPLVVGRGLFERRDPLGNVIETKANKGDRGQYAEVLATALKDPDEIWASMQTQLDGSVRLTRTYVAAFVDPDGEKYWMTVVFTQGQGMWSGTTAFAPGKSGKPKGQATYVDTNSRIGTLIYRRKK